VLVPGLRYAASGLLAHSESVSVILNISIVVISFFLYIDRSESIGDSLMSEPSNET